uniref:Uncharacterized protein n=1 Tax=Anopheles coluzzii TaxID=1518534 RepID=A0A8W7P0B1_ANOCL
MLVLLLLLQCDGCMLMLEGGRAAVQDLAQIARAGTGRAGRAGTAGPVARRPPAARRHAVLGRFAYSLYASAGDCWSSMPRYSFAFVRLLRISATSNVGRWLISSVSTCVLSAVHASSILSRKSRCLNTKCCSSASDFCISSRSDAMSVRMWSRASACVFTGCCRCSSPLAQPRHRAALHFRHQSAFGIACVRQFSPLLRYLPDPIALTTVPPTPSPIPLTSPPAPLPITPAALPFEGGGTPTTPVMTDPLAAPLLPAVTATALMPLATLLLLLLAPPAAAAAVELVGEGTPPATTIAVPPPPLLVPEEVLEEPSPPPPPPPFGLSGGFLLAAVTLLLLLPLEIMLRFCDR